MNDADCLRWRTPLAELETTATDALAEDALELAARLEVLKLRLVLRAQAAVTAPAMEKGEEDRLLDAEQVAALLGVKTSWVYDHAVELPRIPLPGRILRFSARKLRRWMLRTTG